MLRRLPRICLRHVSASTRRPNFASRIYNFLHAESKALRLRLDDLGEAPGSHDQLLAPPALAARLRLKPDAHSKLVAILDLNPYEVPPALVLHYATAAPGIQPHDRLQILRFLAARNCWRPFWRFALQDAATIADIDDAVEVIGGSGTLLSPWLALHAARDCVASTKVFSAISDAIQHRCAVEAAAVAGFLADTAPLDALDAESVVKLATLGEHRLPAVRVMWAMRKVAVGAPFDAADLARAAGAAPGGLAAVLECKSDVAARDIHRCLDQMVLLSVQDHSVVAQVPGVSVARMWRQFCVDFPANAPLPRRLVNLYAQRAVAAGDSATVLSILGRAAGFLDQARFEEAADVAVAGGGVVLLRRAPDFAAVAAKLAPALSGAQIVDLAAVARGDCLAFRAVLKNARPDLETLQLLLPLRLSAYNTAELFRYSLRGQHWNHGARIFDLALQRSWRRDELLKRENVAPHSNPDDFRRLYRHANAEERKRLLRLLRTFAQAISTQDARSISCIINVFHAYIHSDLAFVGSPTGKSYLADRLFASVMHFVHRRHSTPGDGVKAIRTILAGLQFDLQSLQAALFLHMVRGGPSISLNIIRNYASSNTPLPGSNLAAIERGILLSRLSDSEKLALFQKFHALMALLGYTRRMCTQTASGLGDLAVRIGKRDGTLRDMRWLVDMGLARKVPLRKVKDWARAVKSASLSNSQDI